LRDVPDLYNGCLVPGSTDIGIFFEVRVSGRYVNKNTNDWGMYDAFKFRERHLRDQYQVLRWSDQTCNQ
jgi:hypothetical protein